jgi:haloalkane dehalogenase
MTRTTERPAWLDTTEYPFNVERVRVRSGYYLNTIDEGSGPPMLFVHGTPTWSFEWRHVVRALLPAHRCIAPDLLGFGLSDRPHEFAYTPQAHAEVLANFVDAIGLRDFTLVVHDFGGPIALPLALESTRVNRLVVVNSWMWSFVGDTEMEKRARIAGGALGRFLYRHLNFSLRSLMPYAYGDRSKLTPAIHQQYLAAFPDAWSRGAVLWPLARALLGSSKYYDSLWTRRDRLARLPSTIIWGMRDRAFPPRYLDRWKAALPNANVVELPVGHWPHEEAPDDVIRAIRATDLGSDPL